MKDRRCPLCGASHFAPSRFGLLRCTACGLQMDAQIWQPLANEAMEELFFGETYEPEGSSWVRIFEHANNRRTWKRISENVRSGARILEIGVGSGSFLAFARDRGCSVLGCDLSPSVCNRVSRRYGVPMHCGPVDQIPVGPNFDIAILNHVLEHVAEPVTLLTAVRQRMRPGGLVHIAVPNIECWEATLPGWNSYEPYHLTYFSPATLASAVAKAGISIVRQETHESFSGWFLAVLRTLAGNKSAGNSTKRRRHTGLEHAYRTAMVTSGLLTWPLRISQAAVGRGDEAIAVARV